LITARPKAIRSETKGSNTAIGGQKRKNFQRTFQKLKWPLWRTQIHSDLSKAAIKKPNGKFEYGFNITVLINFSTGIFYIKS